MERLTKRERDGVALKRCITCRREDRPRRCGYCEHDAEVITRLADYEDTGLTPEEIKNIISTSELRIVKITAAEEEEIRKVLKQFPGVLHADVDKTKADVLFSCGGKEGRVLQYLPGDTVYDRFGMAWTVTTAEVHKFEDGKLRHLYRCGHPGTTDYRALYADEICPAPETECRFNDAGRCTYGDGAPECAKEKKD